MDRLGRIDRPVTKRIVELRVRRITFVRLLESGVPLEVVGGARAQTIRLLVVGGDRKGAPVRILQPEDGIAVVVVQDPAMLKGLKAGDKVKFAADRVNGRITIVKLEKAK